MSNWANDPSNKAAQLIKARGLDPNNVFGLCFHLNDEGLYPDPCKKLHNSLNVKGLPGGVVIGNFIFFETSEDQEKALEELTNNENIAIDGGGIDGATYRHPALWADYESDSDYYIIQVII